MTKTQYAPFRAYGNAKLLILFSKMFEHNLTTFNRRFRKCYEREFDKRAEVIVMEKSLFVRNATCAMSTDTGVHHATY